MADAPMRDANPARMMAFWPLVCAAGLGLIAWGYTQAQVQSQDRRLTVVESENRDINNASVLVLQRLASIEARLGAMQDQLKSMQPQASGR